MERQRWPRPDTRRECGPRSRPWCTLPAWPTPSAPTPECLKLDFTLNQRGDHDLVEGNKGNTRNGSGTLLVSTATTALTATAAASAATTAKTAANSTTKTTA